MTILNSFNRWSRLAKATKEQRQRFFLSSYGIHWSELDEDLSFSGLFSDAGLATAKMMRMRFIIAQTNRIDFVSVAIVV